MTTSHIETQPPSVFDRPLAEVFRLDAEKALYLILIALAFVTRFYDLGARVMSHDESLHTQYSWYLYEGRGFQHSPLMHGPLKFELTAFTYWLLGDNDFTARIPTALMGVAAVGLFYFFRKWLGRTGALVGAVMMLISPYMLYYARYIRDEPYVITWGMLMALCVLHYMDTRENKYLYGLAAVTSLFYATMEASFIYVAIFMLFLGLYLVRQLATVAWPEEGLRRPFLIAFAVTMLSALALVAFLIWQRQGGALATGTQTPADPNAPLSAASMASPKTLTLLLGLLTVGALGAGAFLAVRGFGEKLRDFPALNLLMVFGLFVLPQLAAIPALMLGKDPLDYTLPNLASLFTSNAGVTAIIVVVLLIASFALGWLWDWRTFLICAGIFYGIYIPTFTTFFTNGGGLATGLVGSLGYWLAQHEVRRGGQPLYYYLVVNLPVYEFLPVIGALFAIGGRQWGLGWWDKNASKLENTKDLAEMGVNLAQGKVAGLLVGSLARLVFGSVALFTGEAAIALFGFWAIGAIAAFSYAGEKMPWLTTHMTLPLILLSGWSIGGLIDRVDWAAFRARRGWIVALIMPVTVVAALTAVGHLLGANPPLQGVELPQQQATLAFVSALIITAMGIAAIYYLGSDFGWANVLRVAGLSFFALLALITARVAFVAAYINYDYANEYLVYAHGAHGVKTIMKQIEDVSMRTTDGLGLKVAYDDKWSWPGSWYLRDYTNQAYYGVQPTRDQLQDAIVVLAAPEHYDKVERLLKDNYYEMEYLRMVWPMQDYWSWSNPLDGQPLAPGYCRTLTPNMPINQKSVCDKLAGGLWTNAQYRQALWNIWWDRDYTLYGQLTGTDYSLAKWPVNDRIKMYVRKDVAAQIWDFGVGPSTLVSTTVQEYPAEKRITVNALTSWGRFGTEVNQFYKPRGVAVGPDGSVYVADANNHRIQKFDAEGNLISAWGGKGTLDTQDAAPGKFNEPWGVAVGPDGSVYVADTWNHRVQKFDADGNFITLWGRFGNDAAPDAFWGPRAVVVDQAGQVYVADTGNKRIAVFDADGKGLTTIGLSGFDPGQFDEPVGLAMDADGTLYVADTWNQRIQAFTPDDLGEYRFAREWPVLGWESNSLDNKPYLAVDALGRVYATDPENYRILVFDPTGQLVSMWGEYGFDSATFSLPTGIAVDAEGNVYVTDGGTDEDGNHRVIKFPPLP